MMLHGLSLKPGFTKCPLFFDSILLQFCTFQLSICQLSILLGWQTIKFDNSSVTLCNLRITPMEASDYLSLYGPHIIIHCVSAVYHSILWPAHVAQVWFTGAQRELKGLDGLCVSNVFISIVVVVCGGLLGIHEAVPFAHFAQFNSAK